MPTSLIHIQSSDLSRNPLKVFNAAEDGPVLLTRRDGENLLIMTEREAEAQQKVLQFAAQLIAVTTDDRGTLAERMASMFPWMYALNLQEQEACSKELVDSARASFSTQKPFLVLAALSAWEATATAIAGGYHNEQLDWLDEPLAVERPHS
ncbi:MAG: hypothetical protein RL508_848 [Actinomycetota bacterium]|jgi:hypothetical protein